MVYTYYRTTPTNPTKLWDPEKTLGIINSDPGYQRMTCVGHAPSKGRRCRIALSSSNVSYVDSVLREISFMDPTSPTVKNRLQSIARPALCVRYHQSQESSILQEWTRKIQQLKRVPLQSLKQEPSEEVELKLQQISQMMEQLESLRERLKRENGYDSASARSFGTSASAQGFENYSHPTAQQVRQPAMNRRAEEEREAQRQAQEQLLREQEEQERLERERRAKEEQERKQQEGEQRERIRREREQSEKEQRERKEREREQREREKREKEEREREERERTEREQREQRARDEREKQKRERDERARQREERDEAARQERSRKFKEEWEQRWTDYQINWTEFRSSTTREGQFLHLIPWPVKSGSHSDVTRTNVRSFFKTAVQEVSMDKVMRRECLKWHPDQTRQWLRGAVLSDVEQIMVDMVCRVVTELLTEAANKS